MMARPHFWTSGSVVVSDGLLPRDEVWTIFRPRAVFVIVFVIARAFKESGSVAGNRGGGARFSRTVYWQGVVI